MRTTACAIVGSMLIGSAIAQERPEISGSLGDALKALPAGVELSTEQARALNSAALADGKLDPAEKAILERIAAGAAFSATANGSPVSLKPGGDAQRIAGLLARPGDMNPMWSDPEKFGDLVELSRWAQVSKDRATRFVGSRLLEAANQSDVFNGYSPFRTLLESKWAFVKSLPDADAREAGRQLLYDASVLVRNQIVQGGRSLPDAAFVWLNSEMFKDSIK